MLLKFLIRNRPKGQIKGDKMNKNECRMERVSNVTVGFVLLFVGLLFAITGITVLPVIGFLIAAPVLVLAGIFLVSPRSKACSIIAQKTRRVINN
jgi:hypothetical protein